MGFLMLVMVKMMLLPTIIVLGSVGKSLKIILEPMASCLIETKLLAVNNAPENTEGSYISTVSALLNVLDNLRDRVAVSVLWTVVVDGLNVMA